MAVERMLWFGNSLREVCVPPKAGRTCRRSGGRGRIFNSPSAKAGSVFFFPFSNTQPDWQQHTVAPSWKVGATSRLLDGQNAWTTQYDVYPCYPIPPPHCLQSVCLLFVSLGSPPPLPALHSFQSAHSFLPPLSLSLSLFLFFNTALTLIYFFFLYSGVLRR